MKEAERKTLENLLQVHRFRIPSFSIYSALTGTINTFDLVPDRGCLVCGQSSTTIDSIQIMTVDSKSLFGSILDVIRQKYGKDFVKYVYDEKGDLNGYLQFLVNGKSVTTLQGLRTRLKDEDKIAIIPPVGGG